VTPITVAEIDGYLRFPASDAIEGRAPGTRGGRLAVEYLKWTSRRYHQPSDEYRPDLDLSGAVQLSEIVLQFGRQIADAPKMPTCNADAEFRRPAGPEKP